MLAEGGQEMTTERTPIRRRLAIRGGSHGPPWGFRKGRHRTIVAPLAATLAATAVVGLGVVLTRAAEAHRPRRRRRPSRRLGLGAHEPLAAGLRRMALEQADLVLDELTGALDGDGHSAVVHESRKAIKRLRAIVRLLEGELGRQRCAREQEVLRRAATLLAGARDAEVKLATLDALLEREKGKLARRPGVVSLRLALVAERERSEREATSAGNLRRVAEELRGFRARAAAWDIHESGSIGPVEAGLHRIYGQGRRRMGRAEGHHGGRMRTMHQWRKRVKDLRYAAEVLERSAPTGTRLRSAGGNQGTEARWMHRLAERADKLGELLGDEHDLAVLGEWIESDGALAGAGRGTRRRLGRRIERRRAKLRRKALRQGHDLYRRPTGKFVRRAGKAYKRSSPRLTTR